MRPGYSSVGGGESFSSYILDERDLEQIVAEHFGYDLDTFNMSGVELPEGAISVSGYHRMPELPDPNAP